MKGSPLDDLSFLKFPEVTPEVVRNIVLLFVVIAFTIVATLFAQRFVNRLQRRPAFPGGARQRFRKGSLTPEQKALLDGMVAGAGPRSCERPSCLKRCGKLFFVTASIGTAPGIPTDSRDWRSPVWRAF